MDILDIPEENKKFWRHLIHDYKITVIPMADQPEEIRAKYQSDYKIIADYLALHKNKKELMRHLRKDQREIIHVEQLLDMLRALSGDRRFDTIKEYYVNNENKEECNKMCLLLDMCEQEGIRKGRKEGIRKGRKKGIRKGRKKGIQEGIFLFQKALRLEANGKTKKEIAKELKISLAMVENILGTGHLSS